LKLPIDARDAFFLAGLGGVCSGVAGEFGWTWALIVGGAVLLLTATLTLRARGD
jgi:phage shock protein PspC (stress-responsive transcriptional regulator)